MTLSPGTCTARWATANAYHDAGDICGAPAVDEIGDSELCRHHWDRAVKWFIDRKIELPLRHQREVEESRRLAAEKARLAAEARSIVYYLRRTDGLIKIGTSTSYLTRFKDLRRAHGDLALLVARAGGYPEETAAHNRFAAVHVGGEWFRPALPLLLEIQRMRVAALGRISQLPEQVPMAEVRALIKVARREQRAAA